MTLQPQRGREAKFVQDVWGQVLDSDPLKYSDLPQTAPQPDAWLLRNLDMWLYPTHLPEIRMGSARVVLVVGEAGCGKSTTMHLIANELRQDERLPIFIDFSHVPTVRGREYSEQELTHALNSYVSTQIRNCLRGSVDSDLYTAQLIRTVFTEASTPEIEEFRVQNEDIVDWPDGRLLACKPAVQISRNCEAAESEEFLSLTAVQMIRPESPPVLVVDNFEGLPAVARRILIGKLTAVLRPRTLLFLSVRSENRCETNDLWHDRNVEVFSLEKVDQSLLDIALIRNNGAHAYALQNPGKADAHKVAEAADSQRESFEKAVRNLRNDAFSFAMASNWLNSDVRNFLGLMASLSHNIPDDGDYGEMRAWLSTTLFQTRTHSSLLKIFSQAYYTSTKYEHPFVFLPLRILFYINTKGGEVSVSQLEDDFVSHFGIERGDIRDALTSFTASEPGSPKPLRKFTDAEGADHMLLLKCGKEFVESALYRFDFLANLFDKVESADLHRRYSSLASDEHKMPDSRLKLLKGVAVIDKLVIPAFCMEHPYMETYYPLNEYEWRRLRSYDELFRFAHGRWFIGTLRYALEEFARPRNLMHDVDATISRLKIYESNLDMAATAPPLTLAIAP